MHHFLKDPCEEIDACVFSSDQLYDKKDREAFRAYLERWKRAIDELDQEEDS